LGRFLVPRLAGVDDLSPSGRGAPNLSGSGGSSRDWTRIIEFADPGDLASAAPRTVLRREPVGDEVELQVHVAALNFRDVLAGLGMVEARTTGALGHECAGVVTRVGSDVKGLRPGDNVLALAEGAFGDHVVCPAHRLFPKPPSLGWAESATLPIAYLTAYHALVLVADLKRGQLVLIHGGAGGVGQAAIPLALSIGAEVYATAGTPERRSLLERMGVTGALDSRSTDFRDEILGLTDGKGVDVVLNSLSGEAVDAGLALLPRDGTFVELGKRDIRSPEDVAAKYSGVRYVAFDLFDEIDEAPQRYQAIMAKLASSLEKRELTPLPYHELPRSRITDAFQLMSHGGHVGKILLRIPGQVAAEVRADATYLITGGTGEVGLRSAEWLIDRGALSLALASRRPPEGEAAKAVSRMKERGADVVWVEVDVTDPRQVESVVRQIRAGSRPLKGVIHSAGAVADSLLSDLDPAKLAVPLASKFLGAWNLIQALDPAELDFLLLYSAAGSILDPAGQGGYAASNALVDALAVQMKGQRWPVTSVAWGLWGGGMAASMDAAHRERWKNRGLRSISSESAGTLLDRVLAEDRDLVYAVLIDWERYRSEMGEVDPVLSEVARGDAVARASDREGVLRKLSEVSVHRRPAALLEHLFQRLIKVLGDKDPDTLDRSRPFKDLGLDSLMAVEFRNILTRDLGLPLSVTLAFDYPDLGALSQYVSNLLFDPQSGPLPAVPAESEDALPAAALPEDDLEVTALNDEEAERLLLEELG